MADLRYTPRQPQPGAEWARDVVATNDAVRRFSDKFIGNIADGILLENVVLSALTATNIGHELGRTLQGWHVIRDRATPVFISAVLSTTSTGGAVDATWSKVPFDEENRDVGGDFDAATEYEFIAPYAGLYNIEAGASVKNLGAGDILEVGLFKNDALWKQGTLVEVAANAGDQQGTVSTCEELAKGDVVDLRVKHDAGGNRDITDSDPIVRFECSTVNWLHDGQLELSTSRADLTLRLYSSIARTVDLWVW